MDKQPLENRKHNDVGELLLHKKVVKMLTLLLQENKWTLSRLKKETGLSFPYVADLAKQFEHMGVVISTKEKKARVISLTEKGEEIAVKMNEIIATIYEEKPIETPAKPEDAPEIKK